MDYPDDPVTYEIDDQFMFGEFLMVAPSARGDSRLVYLPKGRWFDFHTGKLHEGGNRIEAAAKNDFTTIFVKAGTAIPMGPVMQHVGERPLDELELHIFPGAGEFAIYDDDGFTTAYKKGEYAQVLVRVAENCVELGKAEGRYVSTIKSLALNFHGATADEKRVDFGKPAGISYFTTRTPR